MKTANSAPRNRNTTVANEGPPNQPADIKFLNNLGNI